MADARWYIIHVYSGFEKKVMASIREQAAQQGLEDMFEEILVPMEEVAEYLDTLARLGVLEAVRP